MASFGVYHILAQSQLPAHMGCPHGARDTEQYCSALPGPKPHTHEHRCLGGAAGPEVGETDRDWV